MPLTIPSPFEQAPNGHLRCVILDASIDPDLPQWIYQLSAQGTPQWAPLFLETPYRALSEYGPALVMSAASDQWSDHAHSLLTQSDAGCVLYMESRQHWDAAVTHCQSLLSVRTEKLSRQLMRFFDPRWLEPLLEALSDEERSSFFGPISALAWRNELGWRYAARSQPWDGMLQPPGWLRVDQPRQHAMEKARLRLLAARMANDYQAVIEASPAEDFVHCQLLAAHEAGVTQPAHYERWLRLTLERGADFWETAPAKSLLARQDITASLKLDELESLSAKG